MTIDWWTLGIQAVNVVILIWLLARFFWRPVAAMIEQRRATAQQILVEAETKRSQATDALAEIERTRAGFDREREAVIAAAQEAAEEARTAILASATKEAAALEASARTAMEKERDAAEAAWAERANMLAVEIAGRLVARLDGQVVSGRLPRLAPSRGSVAARARARCCGIERGHPRSDQRDRDRIGRPGTLPNIDRRGIRSSPADRLQGGPHPDRWLGTARPSLRRRQQLARRSRQDPRGPRA